MEYVIAKYIRLSMEDSKSDSLSIENQRKLLDNHIDTLAVPCTKVLELVDNGYSGTNFERPAVQELLELVRTGVVQCIVVKDFSRFGRNSLEAGYFLDRIFPLYGVRFISVADGYDTADYHEDTGGIFVSFKCLLSEYYSKDLSRKISSAARERMQRGERISKRCIYGYRKNDANALEIDPISGEVVRDIFYLALSGYSLRAIVRTLYEQRRQIPSVYRGEKTFSDNPDLAYIWTSGMVSNILQNEQYIGTYIAGTLKRSTFGSGKSVKQPKEEWVVIPNHHPPIIPKEVFERVQRFRQEKSEPRKKRATNIMRSPLKSKVKCGCCNHNMIIRGAKDTVFQCQFTSSIPTSECHKHKVLTKEVEQMVLEDIKKQAEACLHQEVDSTSNILDNTKVDTLAENKAQQQQLYERFVIGALLIEEYKKQKAILDRERERLTKYRQEQKKKERTLSQYANITELSREVVEQLIEEVRSYPDGTIRMIYKNMP